MGNGEENLSGQKSIKNPLKKKGMEEIHCYKKRISRKGKQNGGRERERAQQWPSYFSGEKAHFKDGF